MVRNSQWAAFVVCCFVTRMTWARLTRVKVEGWDGRVSDHWRPGELPSTAEASHGRWDVPRLSQTSSAYLLQGQCWRCRWLFLVTLIKLVVVYRLCWCLPLQHSYVMKLHWKRTGLGEFCNNEPVWDYCTISYIYIYFYMCLIADVSQLNLPHRTENQKQIRKKEEQTKNKNIYAKKKWSGQAFSLWRSE